MLGSGWRVGEGERRGGDLCVGSGASFVEMEKLKVAGSVWGAEEAFLSPPDYGGPLAATFESEESSEDCEDYISGLAEEIAQSMLQEDDEASMKTAAPWGIGLSKPAWSGHQMASSPTSPQSTLAGLGGYNWEVRSPSPGGNMGGSCGSGVSSPPTPQGGGDAMDVLYADLLRVKLEDQVKLASQQQMLSLQQQIIQRPTPSASSNVLPPDNHLPLDKFSALKTSKHARSKGGGQELENCHYRGGSKQVGSAGWGCGPVGGQNNKSGKGIIINNSSSNSSSGKRREEGVGVGVQQYHQFSLFASNMESSKRSMVMTNRKQEGMRAVFLGSPSSSSRECGGTGVFLPRRLGSTSTPDSKRKPACSTVLLPSRIVHALNLNIEDTLPSPHRRDFPSSNSHWRRNPQVAIASRRSKSKDEVPSCYFPTSHPTTLQEVAPDISLPSEWTY